MFPKDSVTFVPIFHAMRDERNFPEPLEYRPERSVYGLSEGVASQKRWLKIIRHLPCLSIIYLFIIYLFTIFLIIY